MLDNIGRPSIGLMMPPAIPKTRKVDESYCTMINHADFDNFRVMLVKVHHYLISLHDMSFPQNLIMAKKS